MSKRARLERAISGELPDRVPVALWRHFPGDDQRPPDFVESLLGFQRQYDWDLIKVTPASSYCLADYGAQDEWIGSLEGTNRYTRRVVQRSADWLDLRPLDPTRGTLSTQVAVLRMLKEALGSEDVPYIMTIYSPLAQAKNLAGSEMLITHLRSAPERLHTGLNTLTESTLRFIEAIRRSKPSGIFYAAQLASYASLSQAEYREFGQPYDLRILSALPGDWWLNVLHIHGEAPMFDLFTEYPVQVINWHDRESSTDLATGKLKFQGAVCGGIGQWNPLHNGTPTEIRAMAREALDQTTGRRFILSTGCVMPITTPLANIRAVRQAVEPTR
ncbi:MAG: uroporphyrinogen decarboxylase [Chloroflexi bacterium CFX4]|nr:uroporphyrinogen decarboxylase [Chloroflexi bacterium CFX4]MDL1921322.1 uroporphyrinogen decarboxylase [Chloroflexi bacterium CFX3]